MGALIKRASATAVSLLVVLAIGTPAHATIAVTEYPIPTPDSQPNAIILGPDGNMWFTEPNADKIGKSTPGGAITEYSVPTPDAAPGYVTAGPDGNVWFTEAFGDKIARITPSGVITEYPAPTASGYYLGITTGSDGNLWFYGSVWQ